MSFMILEDFGCLLHDNIRSRAYLQKLVADDLLPAEVIYTKFVASAPQHKAATPLESEIRRAFRERPYFLYSQSPHAVVPKSSTPPTLFRSFDPDEPIVDTIARAAIPHQTLSVPDLNDNQVVEALKASKPQYFLFSGGSILRRPILNIGKKLIHIHPGIVPAIKGSMAVEWSILLGHPCGASAFFMTERIDEGDIIATRIFPTPGIEFNGIPELYSPHIRSELLLDIIRSYAKVGSFSATPQHPGEGRTYYKMHPSLTNLVLWERADRSEGG